MSLTRLSLCLLATVLTGGAAMAQGGDRGLAGGLPVSRPGLPLDPELLPPNTAPGDCVTRRVTGPGGAYRWDRVECDAERGWAGFDQWGYGRRPIAVETLPPTGPDHRYPEPRREQAFEHGRDWRGDAFRQERHTYVTGTSAGYFADADDRPDDRYGPPPPRRTDYRYAGRDADGYLVWPGKTP